ncbi:MAG: class I SAM-dependent methyltransferase [Ignavibacteriae bacterium]|nr:class I SAM-dependent methyltransferase [Ignavibacteriota bacterium]
MNKVNFDEHAETYEKVLDKDLEFFGEESSYFAEYKINVVKNTIGLKDNLNILEYGCGIGMNIKFFSKHFPDSKISGCDISAKSLEVAMKRNDKSVNFFLINEENISKFLGTFDLIFVSCVFHHIQPPLRESSMQNIFNLLKTNGSFYFFEHNPYNPVTRRIVNTCVWDADAILLRPKESLNLINNAGFKIEEKRYTLFFPIKARKI